ncbi:TIGR02221 family CRISPR-associated protein [Halorhodospira abdelmalekii]|uniref:TIGR02221 family CRISPR-associated protein n=1 Tax=Halorhodospira abdelmalekii TaxID=421629 RepID=UPI0019061424|nr:TIGR02221 family CRISPR-associated protein [Halorhodospira abdelmalekii]MBK1736257.1 TIGR02221 family CRISPR-associated protein [Halorhodospira abdelmalekii]
MPRVLITHIGKPREEKTNTEPSSLVPHYQETTYEINGEKFTTPMIGFGLAETTKPDRIIFLGTPGSSWASLIDVSRFLGNCPREDEEKALELMAELETLEKNDRATAKDLAPLGESLRQWLNLPVICQITPYIESDSRLDTARYLKSLDEVIEPKDCLLIDVTHGLRYHPMLALLSAQYFAMVRETKLEGIFYGAFDRSSADGISPVISLHGMLDVLQWVQALHSFDKDGDYGVFEKLLEEDCVPKEVCASMGRAAFFERTSNAAKAKKHLNPIKNYKFNEKIEPLAELFSSALQERLNWSDATGRGDLEIRLAHEYLKRRDYIRAAAYTQEGYISKRLYQEKEDIDDYEKRKKLSDSEENEDFKTLKKIRNSLVHGQRNNGRISRLLGDEESLEKEIKKLMKKLKTG